MANSLEQYRVTIGTHFIFLLSRHYRLCMTRKFLSTILLIYMVASAIQPTLKVVVQNYNMMRFKPLWLIQIYLSVLHTELLQLANDLEVNP